MQNSMTMEQLSELRGSAVYDQSGSKIGSVEEVFYDADTQQPEWIGIGTGFFGMKRVLVPVAGASVTADGVSVPYSKDMVKDTPDVDGDEISEDTERQLYSYYASRTRTPAPTRPWPMPARARARWTSTPRSAPRSTSTARVTTRSPAPRRSSPVGTRRVETGRLRVRKWVETEPVQAEVTLERESAHIVREPINEVVSGATIGEDAIEVTLEGEEAVVDKRVVGQGAHRRRTSTARRPRRPSPTRSARRRRGRWRHDDRPDRHRSHRRARSTTRSTTATSRISSTAARRPSATAGSSDGAAHRVAPSCLASNRERERGGVSNTDPTDRDRDLRATDLDRDAVVRHEEELEITNRRSRSAPCASTSTSRRHPCRSASSARWSTPTWSASPQARATRPRRDARRRLRVDPGVRGGARDHKRRVLRERIIVRKRVVTEQETVEADLRRERVEVDVQGDVDVTGLDRPDAGCRAPAGRRQRRRPDACGEERRPHAFEPGDLRTMRFHVTGAASVAASLLAAAWGVTDATAATYTVRRATR
jgi:stress response protein YsnF/sporulation protein YlmC with PRC-barrel domain